MELQFQSNICRYLKTAVHEVRNMELTQEVRLSDGMPDVGRVLTSWGQIVLRSKEWQGDLVTVSGGVMVWTLYAPEDGTQPRCMDTWVPFQFKWEIKNPCGEGPIRVYPLLRFVDGRGISARKIMLRVGVGVLGEALSPAQEQVYHPQDLPEDIHLLQNTYPVRLPVEAGEKTYLIDEELQLHADTALPERLMAYTMLPQLQEKRVAGDKVILRGTGKIHIVYRCSEGKIHAADLELPVSQYAQLEETYGSDAQADVMMGITSLELLQNEGAQIRIKCGMVAQYLITDRYLAEVSEDAYSANRGVVGQLENLQLPAVLEQRTELVQAHQKFPAVAADVVVDAICLPDFPRQSRTGDQMVLDCAGQFQLLYYTPEGVLQGTTAGWETPMQISADQNCEMSFLIQPSGTVQAVVSGEELHVNSQLKLETNTRKQTEIPMLTSLDVGPVQEPDSNRPSLILCRCEGESLWNLAKRCGSTVEEIIRINHLDGTPLQDQMLLIPVS